MSSEAEPSASDAEPDRSSTETSRQRGRSTRRLLAYALFTVMLAICVLCPLLSFSHPYISRQLLWIYVACLTALFFLFVGVAYRLWWKELAIYLAILAVFLLPLYQARLGVDLSLRWLCVIGFKIHASPLEQYLARCDLVRFNENGREQSVGKCETLPSLSSEEYVVVFYDSTGELMLPISQRTPEWTAAMRQAGEGFTLAETEDRASHLYGNFYDAIF